MKESVSISGEQIENISLNFTELREKGLEYIQKFSGDVWTDYNLHDPGVTILDQLCYALTDIGYRTSLPIKDLLTPEKGKDIDALMNAFFAPSAILSSHPIAIKDTRKLIIDQFEEIQNVWITPKENLGFEEQVNGLYSVEILPKLNFHKSLTNDTESRIAYENKVADFLRLNRNIGETYESVCLLNPQPIQIHFGIYLTDQVDVEATIASIFLKLFEFIYSPVSFCSFNEMVEAGYSITEIFSGPRLQNGFIKSSNLKERVKEIQLEVLQKYISKVQGVTKCKVEQIKSIGRSFTKSITVKDNYFFNLLNDEEAKMPDDRLETIYSNLEIFVNNKILSTFNKQKVNTLFFEMWSKKYRKYPLSDSKDEDFQKTLAGVYRNPTDYYSIQRHFPLIYGIGEEGLSSLETEERKAKALQLKAYLLLFEQHLANHLAQLGNLNELFNVDFGHGEKKTYFSQLLNSVPGIENLTHIDLPKIDSYLEQKQTFYNRKNRIFDHLLARFGEDLNETPWKVALHLNLIRDEDEFNRELLLQKSNLIQNLPELSYSRIKGESLKQTAPPETKIKIERIASGIEKLIAAKTGIPERSDQSLIPELIISKSQPHDVEEKKQRSRQKFAEKFRELSSDEIRNNVDRINQTDIPEASFGKIGLRALFKETLDYRNYRISHTHSSKDKTEVIFQKEPNVWVSLFECETDVIAVQNIFEIVNYFIEQNRQSEGFYLVDHILLLDLLHNSKFGFTFLDEYESPIFQTLEDESWCGSEEERTKNLIDFFARIKAQTDTYPTVNEKWVIKSRNGQILASCDPKSRILNPEFHDPQYHFNQAKSIARLFDWSIAPDGRLILKELEKIRLMGSHAILKNRHFGQRRLVFQRKLSTGEIIDEDFFNLKISVLLPDWPARFQDERFKDYLTDLIHERLPAHIGNEIHWVDAHWLKRFERNYHDWEKLKSGLKNPEAPSDNIKSAALKIYKLITDLKKVNK